MTSDCEDVAWEPTSGPQGTEWPVRRPVVTFDFDGTITKPDSFHIFLTQVRSRRAIARAYARHAPSVTIGILRGGPHRDRAKERFCGTILGGMSEDVARAAAVRTADILLSTALRNDTVSRLRWHLRSGHRVVVVSASFEAYVKLVAAALGVEEVIATRWEVDGAGRLTGGLLGGNVRGPAKERLLTEHLGGRATVDVAYGNTRGDAAMLAMARHPVWVRRWRPLANDPSSDGP